MTDLLGPEHAVCRQAAKVHALRTKVPEAERDALRGALEDIVLLFVPPRGAEEAWGRALAVLKRTASAGVERRGKGKQR